jgi:hypothetical protein
MILELLRKCPAHAIAIQEAAGLSDPVVKPRLSGWQFIQSADTNLAVGVRSDGTANLRVLFDSTDPQSRGGRDYPDDPTGSMEEEKILWYLIVEANFGLQTRSGGGSPVSKATLETVRILTFTINNKAATDTLDNVRLRLRQLFLDVARFQVDYVGGDANAAMYRYYRGQRVPCIEKSVFSVMKDTLVAAVNSVLTNSEHHIHAGMVTSNSQETLSSLVFLFQGDTEEALRDYWDQGLSIDCVIGVVFSWGHSATLQAWRQENAREIIPELVRPHLGFPEFDIRVADFPFFLENTHLWLRTTGNGDTDWHSPLFVRLRTLETKNKRKRSTAAAVTRCERDLARMEARGLLKGKGKGKGKPSQSSPPWQSTTDPASSSWQTIAPSTWQSWQSDAWWDTSDHRAGWNAYW